MKWFNQQTVFLLVPSSLLPKNAFFLTEYNNPSILPLVVRFTNKRKKIYEYEDFMGG